MRVARGGGLRGNSVKQFESSINFYMICIKFAVPNLKWNKFCILVKFQDTILSYVRKIGLNWILLLAISNTISIQKKVK